MKRVCHLRFGFTMVEIMVSAAILSLGLGMALTGWLYVFRGEKMISVQNKLDMDVRSAMERVRADLRLSSIDKIYYYPAGPGPYTAISLPLARDDDGNGVLEMDADGHIIWDQTVIYHVWAGTPNELRKTIFDPRNTNRTPAEMQAQIDSVVTYGNGTMTPDSATAHTSTLFRNLFEWKIYGKGAQYDAYRPSVTRDPSVVFGSALLTPGPHYFTFKVVGKNASSSGYRIDLDSIVMSPCGVPREAEAQTVYASVGAAPMAQYMSGGSWDGNYQLSFPATAPSNSFTLTMSNDRWEETNFRTTGSQCDDALVDFVETWTPKDYIVCCRPQTTNWRASFQTLDEEPDKTAGLEVQGAAIRVLLRGADMQDGNGIKNSGQLHCIWLYSASNADLNVLGAYFAECASDTNFTPNAKDVGVTMYVNGSSSTPGTTITRGQYARFEPLNSTPIYIEREKSYFFSFLVADDGDRSGCTRWEQKQVSPSNPVPPGCYIIDRTSAPDLSVAQAANWSSYSNLAISPYLYAVDHVHCLAASNGTWTSQIVDTHINAPTYQNLTWNDSKPTGTKLFMRLRTANNEDMSDATSWSNIAPMSAGGAINPPSKRYVQVQSEMFSDSSFNNVAKLKDFTVTWNGETRVADIGGTITQSPSNGIFEILLDGSNIIKRGVTIDLTIFEWVRGFSPAAGTSNLLTSTVSAEVEPRNTGK